MNEETAFELVKKAAINGREGFFCLTLVENLTLKEALEIYRQKDSIEKIFHFGHYFGHYSGILDITLP